MLVVAVVVVVVVVVHSCKCGKRFESGLKMRREFVGVKLSNLPMASG